jgi:hypothetical protein
MSTTTPVLMPSQRLRWAEASERCPVIGAVMSTTRPARVRASDRACDVVAASPKALPVRYTVNTKEVATALIEAEPQSHSPHAMTARREVAVGGVIVVGAGRSGSDMFVTVCPFGEHRVARRRACRSRYSRHPVEKLSRFISTCV